MAYTNPNNMVLLHGNLAADPKIFDNQDGSKKVMFTVACQRPRKNAEGKRDADFIQCEHFISKDAKSMGPYDPQYMKKGTQVSVAATIETGRYEAKESGDTVNYTKFNVVELSLGYQPRGGADAETTSEVEDAAAKLAAAATPAPNGDGTVIPL